MRDSLSLALLLSLYFSLGLNDNTLLPVRRVSAFIHSSAVQTPFYSYILSWVWFLKSIDFLQQPRALCLIWLLFTLSSAQRFSLFGLTGLPLGYHSAHFSECFRFLSSAFIPQLRFNLFSSVRPVFSYKKLP